MYQVFQAGWHTLGAPHNYPIPIFPIVRHQPDEPERLVNIIRQNNPHFVLAIGDPFYFPYIRHIKEKTRQQNCRWVGWITVDGDPLHPQQLGHLLPFDRVLYMSAFAKEQSQAAIEMARGQEGGYVREKKKGKDGEEVVTPHDSYELDRLESAQVLFPGVDPQTFGVLQTLPHWGDKDGEPYSRKSKFVVLVVDQNTSRKAVGVAIDAYRQFRVGREENVALHLVTNPTDPNGINLNEVLGTEDREDVVIHPNSPISGPNDEDMNMLYNLATVLFSATSGEGFKLPITEAMMTRCLNVMPAYTSPVELLGEEEERGILIGSPEDCYWYGSFGYRKRIIPRDKCVEALVRAYDLWRVEGLEPTLNRAHQFAMGLPWDKTFDGVTEAFRQVFELQSVDMVAV
jgi:glycosyltransferase involved in cell wall biosynthesis